jgi:hypothetical protein
LALFLLFCCARCVARSRREVLSSVADGVPGALGFLIKRL